MSTPEKLKGKEFEELLLAAAKRSERLTMSRYGVQVSMFNGKWTPVPSLPDFEGVLTGGRHFIIEAKVASGASLRLDRTFIKPRQVSHMLERSRFGTLCFVVIHFNARRSARINDPATTVAVPVNDSLPMWRCFLEDIHDTITRDRAWEIGTPLIWTTPKGCRKPLPDLDGLLNTHPSALVAAPETPPTKGALVEQPDKPRAEGKSYP